MPDIPLNIVVVGGSAGLGKVVAEMYANDGFQVSIISRNRPQFLSESENFHHFAADLMTLSAPEAEALALSVANQVGPVSYVIFCQRYRGQDRSLSNEVSVSITSTDLLIKAFVPYFAEHGDRAIAAVSSVYADFVGSSQPLSYHVVKAGLNALIRYYAVMLGEKGIRTNAISPLTYLKDESKHVYLNDEAVINKYVKLVPLKRMPTAEECANTIRYLCSPQASFVNGQIMYVDGGVSAVWPEELV